MYPHEANNADARPSRIPHPAQPCPHLFAGSPLPFCLFNSRSPRTNVSGKLICLKNGCHINAASRLPKSAAGTFYVGLLQVLKSDHANDRSTFSAEKASPCRPACPPSDVCWTCDLLQSKYLTMTWVQYRRTMPTILADYCLQPAISHLELRKLNRREHACPVPRASPLYIQNLTGTFSTSGGLTGLGLTSRTAAAHSITIILFLCIGR